MRETTNKYKNLPNAADHVAASPTIYAHCAFNLNKGRLTFSSFYILQGTTHEFSIRNPKNNISILQIIRLIILLYHQTLYR